MDKFPWSKPLFFRLSGVQSVHYFLLEVIARFCVRLLILLANSRRRPVSRSLVKLGTLEDRNSAPRTAQTNSPTVSPATGTPRWVKADLSLLVHFNAVLTA